MTAPKKERTPQAAARHDKNRAVNEAGAQQNAERMRLVGLEGGKRPSKLVRQVVRAEARHEDALRLKMMAQHPDGGDAA